MNKMSSFLLVMIMLLALALTGCGAPKIATGDLPAGAISKSVVDTAQKAEDGSAVKANEQTTDQAKSSENQEGETKLANGSSSSTSTPATPAKVATPAKAVAPAKAATPAAAVAATPAPVLAATPVAKNTITFSISCKTAVAKGMQLKEEFKEVVPADGIILPPTVVEFKEGEMVFDILKQVVKQRKLHMEYEGSKGTPYIQGINNLYEFDGGPLSGWMYCVNKIYPNYGCGEYKLKPGQVIEWNYTCDLGKDLGQVWLGK